MSASTKISSYWAWRYLLGLGLVILTTTAIVVLRLDQGFANISLLYLLLVFLLSIYAGRTSAILSAVFAFLAFNWFFVEPRHTLTVNSPQEWITLCMFLLVSTITGHLTAKLKISEQEARRKQLETETLASASWAVSSQLTTEEALLEVLKQIERVSDFEMACVASRDAQGKLFVRASLYKEKEEDKLLPPANRSEVEKTVLAEMESYTDNGKTAEIGSTMLPLNTGAEDKKSAGAIYIKLKENARTSSDDKHLIETLLNHAAVILHREELVKEKSRMEALAEADRLKTALLSMVSHDFRSPLTGIKATVSVLQEESTKETKLRPFERAEVKALLQGIEQEADRLNRMVGNILDMSKLEADAWRPIFESTDVREVIGSALSAFSEAENARVKVILCEGLEEIEVDPVQIEQVLKNLVENALKYSPEDKSVEVQVEQDKTFTKILVKDSGDGISEADRSHIFDRFFRASALAESSVPGVGIGLAIVKALVEAHHGTISVLEKNSNNSGDKGTVMCVQLPNAWSKIKTK